MASVRIASNYELQAWDIRVQPSNDGWLIVVVDRLAHGRRCFLVTLAGTPAPDAGQIQRRVYRC